MSPVCVCAFGRPGSCLGPAYSRSEERLSRQEEQGSSGKNHLGSEGRPDLQQAEGRKEAPPLEWIDGPTAFQRFIWRLGVFPREAELQEAL